MGGIDCLSLLFTKALSVESHFEPSCAKTLCFCFHFPALHGPVCQNHKEKTLNIYYCQKKIKNVRKKKKTSVSQSNHALCENQFRPARRTRNKDVNGTPRALLQFTTQEHLPGTASRPLPSSFGFSCLNILKASTGDTADTSHKSFRSLRPLLVLVRCKMR